MHIEKITVEYLDHMGDDLRVANVARVSFAKWKEEFDHRDKGLLEYLATGLPVEERENFEAMAKAHTHWSPFAHCFLSVRVGAPLFLARQLVKHQVGLSWNEESRRYISNEPSFWFPETIHERPEGSIKQGSAGVHPKQEALQESIRQSSKSALSLYQSLLGEGMAPEEARMVLPLNTMTHWVWSGSLMAFIRVYLQRVDSHAQLAAQEFADKLEPVLEENFPATCDIFKKHFSLQK